MSAVQRATPHLLQLGVRPQVPTPHHRCALREYTGTSHPAVVAGKPYTEVPCRPHAMHPDPIRRPGRHTAGHIAGLSTARRGGPQEGGFGRGPQGRSLHMNAPERPATWNVLGCLRRKDAQLSAAVHGTPTTGLQRGALPGRRPAGGALPGSGPAAARPRPRPGSGRGRRGGAPRGTGPAPSPSPSRHSAVPRSPGPPETFAP